MLITNNQQYPPNPSSGQGWALSPIISSHAVVPAGCPEPYAIQCRPYDLVFSGGGSFSANFYKARLGFFMIEVQGWAIAVPGFSTNLSIFARYGNTYTNTLPNGYIATNALTLSRANFSTWTRFKGVTYGNIPSNGTPNVSVNINASVNASWFIAGVSTRQLQ